MGVDAGGLTADEPLRFRRVATGFRLRLTEPERELVRAALVRLREILDVGGRDARRLQPPAFPDDAEAEASYREVAGEDLADGRERRLETVAATLDDDHLDAAQAEAWLGVLNDIRLAVGTALDVHQDDRPDEFSPDDPDAADRLIYLYATFLQSQLIDELASTLPDTG